MVNVCRKKCKTEGCGKQPFFGVAGTKTVEYCAHHAPDGMVNVYNIKCRAEICGKIPSFGVTGTKTADYCAQHAQGGMVNVKPSFDVTSSRTVEYSAHYARFQGGVEGFRERKVDPHHPGKETIGNVIPSGAKQITVHPSPTSTGQPPGVSWGSRKRVRHTEITSTASTRAVARESTARAVTMPDIDGQKYPVKRNSSVKTEVQLSL
ncbi:unnamed protein product [Ascophyllum nodosum]